MVGTLPSLESEREGAVGGEHDAGLGEGARQVQPLRSHALQVLQQPIGRVATALKKSCIALQGVPCLRITGLG